MLCRHSTCCFLLAHGCQPVTDLLNQPAAGCLFVCDLGQVHMDTLLCWELVLFQGIIPGPLHPGDQIPCVKPDLYFAMGQVRSPMWAHVLQPTMTDDVTDLIGLPPQDLCLVTNADPCSMLFTLVLRWRMLL